MLEAKVLESRLVTKDSTVGGSSVAKIAKSLRDYHKALKHRPCNDESVRDSYDIFVRDTMLYRLEVGKLNKILKVCDIENDNYISQEIEIQKESAEAINKMAELQKELEVQKKIRSYTEKCEAKAKVVNELPVQYITKRHIDECDNSIKNMTSTLEIYDDRIRKRVKQYGDMMLSIDVLCQPLEEPNCTDTNNTAEEEEEDEEDIDNRNDNENRSSRDVKSQEDGNDVGNTSDDQENSTSGEAGLDETVEK